MDTTDEESSGKDFKKNERTTPIIYANQYDSDSEKSSTIYTRRQNLNVTLPNRAQSGSGNSGFNAKIVHNIQIKHARTSYPNISDYNKDVNEIKSINGTNDKSSTDISSEGEKSEDEVSSSANEKVRSAVSARDTYY
jgi:hypothetical protein